VGGRGNFKTLGGIFKTAEMQCVTFCIEWQKYTAQNEASL